MLSTQPYKGARDFYPIDKRLQKYLFNKMRVVVEAFGYEEYDAPILEPLELYISKSGEEIVNDQTYVFEDRGGRTVTLRPEMTPSVSRMVAGKRQELSYPLRWYSIPNLWRYERPQRGRLREHWQLNVDIFGLSGLEAEHEIIQVADSIMNNFGAKREMYEIRINSRKFIDYLLKDYLGISAHQATKIIKVIDRMKKIDHSTFSSEISAILSESENQKNIVEQLDQLIHITDLSNLPLPLRSHESMSQLEKLGAMLENSGITNIVWDISLVRGLDYYTDIIFEVYDTDPKNNRSMFGGGRYDGLISLFGVETLPIVGFGMGDVTLQNFLEGHKLLPDIEPETDIYVVLVGEVYILAQSVLNQLRNLGLRVAVDSSSRKVGQQIKTAVNKELRWAVFIGGDELSSGQYVLRNLSTGAEEKLSLEQIAAKVTEHRKK